MLTWRERECWREVGDASISQRISWKENYSGGDTLVHLGECFKGRTFMSSTRRESTRTLPAVSVVHCLPACEVVNENNRESSGLLRFRKGAETGDEGRQGRDERP